MGTFDIRDMIKSMAPADSGAGESRSSRPRAMPPLAELSARLPVRSTYSPVVIAGIVRVVEFLLIAAAGVAIYRLYLVNHFHGAFAEALAIPIVAGLAVIALQLLNAYQLAVFRAPVAHMGRIVLAWSVIFAALLAAAHFLNGRVELLGVWLASWYVAVLAALFLERGVLMQAIRAMTRAGRLDRRTAIVGGGPAGDALLRVLAAQPDSGVRILGVFDDRDDERSPDVVAGFPKLGKVDDLVAYARHTQIDLVIFTLPISAEKRILEMLRKLWVLPIDIRLSAHMSRLRLTPKSYSYIGAVPVLDVFDKPIADWDLVLKWLFDKVVGALVLIGLSPVFLATAVAVKLDSRGPILFRQKRYGFNNELIEVFKFRSMHVEASDATASKLVTKDDPRVTRVGRFIRRTSIDELPQLINVVFKGNLSLVGPRPHAVHAKAENRLYDQVVDGYFARHKVKPGITGWAQINGWRGETDTEEKIQQRVDHDLYYIENWSVPFDLSILLRTPFALLKSENAY